MIKPILKVEQRSALNYLKSMSDSKKVIYGLLIFFLLIFVLPAAVSLLFLLINSLEAAHLGSLLFLISIMSVVILSLLAVNSIIKEMFMDRSIQLYLTFPVSPGQLFMAKFLKQWLLIVAPVMIPIGLVTGVSMSVRFDEWTLVGTHITYFLLLSVVTMVAAYALVFTVVKIMPAGKVSEVLAFLGGASFILIYIFIFVGSSSAEAVLNNIPGMGWLYEGYLYDFSWGRGFAGILLSLVLSALLILILRKVVTAAFASGWTGEQSVKADEKSRESTVVSAAGTLVRKDLKLTLRDFKEWSVLLPQYLLPGVMIFILYTNPVLGGDAADGNMYNAQMPAISLTGTIIISLFVGAYNTARDAAHFDFLKMLPIQSKDLVKAKYLFNLMTITPVYLLAAVIIWLILPIDLIVLLYSAAFIILTSMAVVPIGMFIGSTEPVVSRKKPANRLDTASNIIITVVIMVLVFAAGGISLLMVDEGGALNHLMLNSLLGVLAALVPVSFTFLKKVQSRYDNGFKITYKD